MFESRRKEILLIAGIALVAYLAYQVRDVLLLIYVCALFAVVLSPAIEAIQAVNFGKNIPGLPFGWRPGRGAAMMMLMLVVVGALGLFFAFAVPPIYHDVQGLVNDWPVKVAQLSEKLRGNPITARINPQQFQEYAGNLFGGAFGFFTGVAGGVFGFFSAVVLTAYFVLDGQRAFYWMLSMVPRRNRPRFESTMLRAERRVRNWLVGQVALMCILGLSSGIVFGLLGLKYFYALAVFAGLANIIPILGPVFSLLLASGIAAMDTWEKLLGVVIFFIVYQQIENAFLTPRIMRSTVDLPPLAIISALSIGGALAGILGALVAVPTAALLAVVLDECLVQPDAKAEAARMG